MAQYLSQSRIEDPVRLEPNEISFVRMRISEEEELVQSFDSRMDELRAQISKLTLQKDAKLVEIASLRNVLASVRRVPLEILTEIFELVLGNRQWRSDIVPHIFRLSSVCAAWRKAVHATPRLWSTLCISLEKVVLGPELIWVEDWIIRSQMVPLDLYLDFYFDKYDESRDVLSTQRGNQLLEYILTQFSHKVRSLNVMGHPSSFLPILHLSPSSSLLSLEEISLTIIDDDDDNDTIEDLVALLPAKVAVFLRASKLRQVKLNNASLLEFLALPAEQLTSLEVNEDEFEFDPVMFVDILSRCKQLVALQIYPPSDGFVGLSMRIPILLPTLTSLEVYNVYNAADNILRCITTPLLEQLHLCYRGTDLDSLVTDLTAFQQRSSTALSFLNLYISCSADHEVEIITEKVIGILSLFPKIWWEI
ncbi:hypothetical protein BT96DRAFT_1009167 [Gymnopus androsaceus JB14]|uniref:Uncharacterized protein n=1 Tax=Gymnopus androsaceus JB14 TaxID=1447944 RepID=A0A6A4GDG4_9AGAR|nr:hypothetical protein BT96DRAFT_1009167 [Gymnopus androsaceus JB14]